MFTHAGSVSVVETTSFGVSFIGGANTASDVGQYGAITSYAPRPITCVSACSRSATTCAVSSSSNVGSTQLPLSPSGAATKPSRDRSIFTLSVRTRRL